MRFSCIRVLAGATLACLFSRVFSHAAPPDRSRGIEDSRLVVLSRDINPLARPAYMRGLVDPSRRISGVSFELQPAARQQTALNVFLKAQRDPGSPEYRHSLTPEEFGDRFGVSRNDLAHLTCWLADQGLTIEHLGEARNWIHVWRNRGADRTSLPYDTAVLRDKRRDSFCQRFSALDSGGVPRCGSRDPLPGRLPAPRRAQREGGESRTGRDPIASCVPINFQDLYAGGVVR